jgi:hypothetical protein
MESVSPKSQLTPLSEDRAVSKRCIVSFASSGEKSGALPLKNDRGNVDATAIAVALGLTSSRVACVRADRQTRKMQIARLMHCALATLGYVVYGPTPNLPLSSYLSWEVLQP